MVTTNAQLYFIVGVPLVLGLLNLTATITLFVYLAGKVDKVNYYLKYFEHRLTILEKQPTREKL